MKPEFTEISKERQRCRERDAKKAKRNGRTSEKDGKRKCKKGDRHENWESQRDSVGGGEKWADRVRTKK